MGRWDSFKWFLDWIGRIRTLVDLLLALGLGAVLKAILANHIPQIWLTPIWLLSSAAILALIAWVVPALFRRHRAAELPPSAAPQSNWCDALAENDKANMVQRVIAVRWEPRRVDQGSNHYIEFKITFVNASVFELKAPRLEGVARLDRHPLPFEVQFDQAFPLSRGQKTWMSIRQPLTAEIARDIQSRLDARDGGVVVNLDFSQVRITFDVVFPGRPTWQWTWEGSDSISVRGTTFV